MKTYALAIAKVVPGKAGTEIFHETFAKKTLARKTAKEFAEGLSKGAFFPLAGYSVNLPGKMPDRCILPVLKPQKSGESIVVQYYIVEIVPALVREQACTAEEIGKIWKGTSMKR